MSAIAGIFHRNGQRLDPAEFEAIGQAVRYRGIDGIDSWAGKNVGLTQLLTANTPEAIHEDKPFFHHESGHCIVFDGRIDNRETLLGSLFATAPSDPITDMQLVLHAYLRWGEGSPARLLGDFAFAIWSIKNQQLFLARDCAGVKPLYYACSDNCFVFGTEICQVRTAKAVGTAVNEGAIAEILACAWVDLEETPYRDIRRLPPAHFLEVGQKSLRVRRYWTPDFSKRLTLKEPRDYIEPYLEVLTEAVRCRMRVTGALGASLSGGLDSGSVASLAQSLLNAEGGGQCLKTYSLVFPGMPCDESGLIEGVAQHCGLNSTLTAYRRPASAGELLDQRSAGADLPPLPMLAACKGFQQQAASEGARVMLTGVGADTWFSGTYYPYYSAMRAMDAEYMRREMVYRWDKVGSRALGELVKSLAWPMLPRSLQRRFESGRKPVFPTNMLEPGFLAGVGFDERVRRQPLVGGARDLAQWNTWRGGVASGKVFGMEMRDRVNATHGVEDRHPFLDRRVIEFALSVPDHAKHRGEFSKALVRLGATRLLPEPSVLDFSEPDMGLIMRDALLLPEARHLLADLEIARCGWVRQVEVERALQRIEVLDVASRERGSDLARLGTPLWMVLSIENWYRGLLS